MVQISSAKDQTDKFPIEKLLESSAFPHAVKDIQIVETHISYVVLTGEFAYKIKKPVHFDFVDYSTLENRREFCRQELTLNRRYCPDIYLDVVPILESSGHFHVGKPLTGGGPVSEASGDNDAPGTADAPVEYAVRMKQFSQESILDHLINETDFDPGLISQFADSVARFHQAEPAVSLDDIDGELVKIRDEVNDNFALLEAPLAATSTAQIMAALKQWSVDEFDRLRQPMALRMQEGKFRKCHGDLHLQNIILHQGKLAPFDGIEFNPDLQIVDVFNEVAFPFMDLLEHKRPDFAWRFLSAYLERDGDYRHLDLIRFFAVYRAMVRAKVTWMNCQNQTAAGLHSVAPNVDPGGLPDSHPWDRYLVVAHQLTQPAEPKLSITFGFSGSGKSTRALVEIGRSGGIQIRSDVERQRIKTEQTSANLYDSQTTDRVYHKLLADAELILAAGYSVVVDATFLALRHRAEFKKLAHRMGREFEILACDASFNESVARIKNRTDDPSEATIEVLKQQMDHFDPLTAEEQACVAPAEGSNSSQE